MRFDEIKELAETECGIFIYEKPIFWDKYRIPSAEIYHPSKRYKDSILLAIITQDMFSSLWIAKLSPHFFGTGYLDRTGGTIKYSKNILLSEILWRYFECRRQYKMAEMFWRCGHVV